MLTSHTMRAQREAEQGATEQVARAPDPGPATAPDPIGKPITLEEAMNLLADREADAALAAEVRELFEGNLDGKTIQEFLKGQFEDMQRHYVELAKAEADKSAAELAKANERAKTAEDALSAALAKVAEFETLKASIAANAAPLNLPAAERAELPSLDAAPETPAVDAAAPAAPTPNPKAKKHT